MAGVLSFALGLESSAFSAGLDRAGTRLLAFLSVGVAVKAAFDNIEKSINRGGMFADLSARTGESVGNLYQLSEVAEIAGVSVDSMPGMINRLNKSLSGVGEMGEKTSEAFSALGLSMDDLKKLEAPEQFKAIAAAMTGLDRGSKLDIASRLFGREGAGNFIQLTSDFQGFISNMDAAAQRAEQVARTASAFDRVGDRFVVLTKRWDSSWSIATGGMLPFINRFQRLIEGMPIEVLGKRLEHVFLSADKMMVQGKFGEFLDLSLQVAFEKGGFYATKFANTLAFAVLAAIPPAIGAAVDIGLKLPGTGLIGLGDFIATEMVRKGLEGKLAVEEKFGNFEGAGRTRTALANLNISQGEMAGTMDEATRQLITSAMGNVGAATTAALKAGAYSWGSQGTPPQSGSELKLKSLVGNVLSPGGSGGALDANKQTATNTRTMIGVLGRIEKKIGGSSNQPLTNL